MSTHAQRQHNDDYGRFTFGPHRGDRLLTVNDMAELLKMTPNSVRSSLRRGMLPTSHKLGGRRLWWESEVSEWIEAGRDPKPHPSN